MICADDSGRESCPAPVMGMPRRRTTFVMIANKTSFRAIFIGAPGVLRPTAALLSIDAFTFHLPSRNGLIRREERGCARPRRARQLLAQSIRAMMIAHLQYFDAEPLGQSEQVVPGPFLEES
jgi:hypothetical protein